MEYLCGYGENAETGEPMNGYNYGWPENNGGSNSRQSSVCSNGYLYGVKDDPKGEDRVGSRFWEAGASPMAATHPLEFSKRLPKISATSGGGGGRPLAIATPF
ncbi:hypothetical protein CRG98_016805 [Punica granatum]|uniref:Uncharacterized protein n=1 Tax=Punica granatum TaxID=22663 RepID=A0A2I0K2L2_PUNGR|nr:hypothetical protein CRG98_016805 [Punica granatum]